MTAATGGPGPLLDPGLELRDGVWVSPFTAEDPVAAADRTYHDAEAARYDGYLVHEPVRSAEAWLVPLLAGLARGVVVDVGCGTGRVSEELARAGRRVIAVDHSPEMVRVAGRKLGERATVVRADARSLPIADGACDGVVMSGVLHHVADYDRVLAEAARVLRPGGTLVVREPHAGYAGWAIGPIERLLARLAGSAGPQPEGEPQATAATPEPEPLHEQPIGRSDLRAATPATLRWRWIASTMLLGSIDVPDAFRWKAAYLRRANAVDRWLLRRRWPYGGALVVGVAERLPGPAGASRDG